MRQIRALIERGWHFGIYMGDDQFFYASATHGTWGVAEGGGDNLNMAIEEMFKNAKELEKTGWKVR